MAAASAVAVGARTGLGSAASSRRQGLGPGQGLGSGGPGQGLGPDHPPYDPAARLSGGELMAMIESDSGKHGSYSNPPRSDTLCCSV